MAKQRDIEESKSDVIVTEATKSPLVLITTFANNDTGKFHAAQVVASLGQLGVKASTLVPDNAQEQASLLVELAK